MTWTKIANIAGPQGATGPRGATGPAGPVGPTGPVNPSGLRQVTIYNESHLDDFMSPGVYVVPGAYRATVANGFPVDALYGPLIVSGGTSFTMQELVNLRDDTKWRRVKYLTNPWSAWKQENSLAPVPGQVGGVDLDTLTTPGVYEVVASPYGSVAKKFPRDRFAGAVIVLGGGSYVSQEAQHFSTNTIYRRFKWLTGSWSPWVEVATQPVGGG